MAYKFVLVLPTFRGQQRRRCCRVRIATHITCTQYRRTVLYNCGDIFFPFDARADLLQSSSRVGRTRNWKHGNRRNVDKNAKYNGTLITYER